MKKLLFCAFCLLPISSQALACGMSIFSTPLVYLIAPSIAIDEAADLAKEGVQRVGDRLRKMREDFHARKAEMRKKPEYLHLELAVDQYLDCAAQQHERCDNDTTAHSGMDAPVFLQLHRKQDKSAWSALVYELLSKKMDKFEAIGKQQTELLPAQFQMTLEKVNYLNMLKGLELSAEMEFKHLFAAYDYRFWTPTQDDHVLKTEFRSFAEAAFEKALAGQEPIDNAAQ